MSIVLKGTVDSVNAQFKALGIARKYSYTSDGRSFSIFVDSENDQLAIGEGYGNTADACADLYMNAFDAAASWAASFKRDADSPMPTRRVYETIRDLVDVAVDGVEARQRDADGLDDRLNVEEGQYAVERGKVIIAQFSDAYRGNDLK